MGDSDNVNTCLNTILGYQFEGGGDNFKLTCTGYSNSITVTKLEYFATKVWVGNPYDIDSWIASDGSTKHYPPAARSRVFSNR